MRRSRLFHHNTWKHRSTELEAARTYENGRLTNVSGRFNIYALMAILWSNWGLMHGMMGVRVCVRVHTRALGTAISESVLEARKRSVSMDATASPLIATDA